MSSDLNRLFEPRSIAIVGASANPVKRGYQILAALQASTYTGEVFPVNPRGGEILGVEVIRSVDELPDGIDLAVFCTPAESSPGLVRACGRRGVAGAVVLAVGFGESGDAGVALESDLSRAAAESGVRIIGPNTSGLLNLGIGLNLVGARGVRSGGLALLVQSGNMALALMTEATERSWDGISVCLGVGNQIDVGFADALEYLQGSDQTRAIILYLEGVTNARALLRAGIRVGRTKPIVAIKSGRTEQGAAAALSHTGSLAGPYDRFSAALRQAGVIEVGRTDELLHVAETVGNQPPCPPGKGIVVLSDGGGQGTLAADSVVEAGAELARLAPSTTGALRTLLGPAAATTNPVDLAGAADADPIVFARALETLLADEAVGVVLIVGLFGGYGVRFSQELTSVERNAAEAMAEAASSAGVGLVVHSMYAAHRTEPLQALGERRVPVIGSLDVACRCVVELQRRGNALSRPVWSLDLPSADPPPDHEAGQIVNEAVADGRATLSELEARSLLEQAGLTFEPYALADSQEQSARAAERFPGLVALKLVSSTIVHKSEAGGVHLDLDGPEAIQGAFRLMEASVAEWRDLHGLPSEPMQAMVSSMARTPRLELIVGGYRDAELGPTLTLGAGGIWVEALADVAHRVLPVGDGEIIEALRELRVGPLLDGGRGRSAVALDPIVAAARAVGQVLEWCPSVREVELNPLFVYETEVVPLDVRVVLG